MEISRRARKILLITLAGISFAIAISLFLTRSDRRDTLSATAEEAPRRRGSVETVSADAQSKPFPVRALESRETGLESAHLPGAPRPGTVTSPAKIAVDHAVNTFLAVNSSFQQKQAAWAQLKQAGRLDEAIGQLEERAANDKRSPEIPASLGQAYLQKAGSIQDIREQGILGLKADQSFDLALNLDPENWEARFWKATAMSYWPPQLGKGKEVLEHLVELVRQQELLPPKPEFAQVYALLGDQYQKQGYADYATQAWKRGLALFPNDPALTGKLTETK